MRRVLLLLLCLPLIAIAEQDNRPPDNRPPDREADPTTITTDASAASEAASESSATGGSATAEGGAGGSGGSVTNNISMGGPAQPDDVTIRNVPSVFAPDVYPTVSCFRGRSGGAAGAGFGISLGGGKIDEDCVKREYIRLAYTMGATDRALFMWCQQPMVWEDFGSIEDCLMFESNAGGATDASGEGLTSEHAQLLAMAAQNGLSLTDVAVVVEEVVQDERRDVETEEIEPLKQQVNDVGTRVARIETMLAGQAAAAEAARREREAWKESLAERYLTDPE